MRLRCFFPSGAGKPRRSFPLLAWLACVLAPPGVASEAPEAPLPHVVLETLRAARIPDNAIAIEVRSLDAPDSPPLLSHNAQAAMNPASVMKLVTTYAALEILGPASVWTTRLKAETAPTPDGRIVGHLYLQGGGDPRLNLESFWRLLLRLRARGVQKIDGDLILDRSVFQPDPYDPAAFDQRPLRAYNVGPDGVLVDFGSLTLRLTPRATATPGTDAVLETPSGTLAVESRLLVTQGACNGWRDRLGVVYAPGHRQDGKDLLSLEGAYPAACGEQTLLLAPQAGNRHVEGLFRALWTELGGSFRGQVRTGTTPETALTLVEQTSPPLAEVIRDVNKWSNNVMARQLFLSLDAAPSGKREGGARQRLLAWLASKNFSFPELVIDNGAGLSRQARISAESLARLLVAAWKSPVMPEFIASMPIAGVDGTLNKRLQHTLATGRAHLKTGTLNGSKAIAGYVQDAEGRRFVLVALINHPNAEAGAAALDALVAWLAAGAPR